MSNVPARIIGEKYLIERPLAEGGMGSLFVARHLLTTEVVAVKVLDRRLARDEASLERFKREVSVAARIGHPGIVRVFDAGVDVTADGERVPFLAMELLSGETLGARFGRGDVAQSAALDRLVAILSPLSAAHARGVVHRDLKPENVFLERLEAGERVKLLDFGIARDIADDRRNTVDGQALGTAYYMSPEQCLDARKATPASDVWSFGVMLYECLTGSYPCEGDTVAAVMLAVCRDPHVPIAVRRPDLDPRLVELVERCIRKSPQDRPADAGVLRRELEPLARDPAVRSSLQGLMVSPRTYLPTHATPPPPAPVPSYLPDLVVESMTPPRVRPDATPAPLAPVSGGAVTVAAAPPPGRRWVFVIAAALGLALVAAAAARRTSTPPAPRASATPAPMAVTAVTPPTVTPPTPPARAEEPSAPPAPEEPTAAAPAEPTPAAARGRRRRAPSSEEDSQADPPSALPGPVAAAPPAPPLEPPTPPPPAPAPVATAPVAAPPSTLAAPTPAPVAAPPPTRPPPTAAAAPRPVAPPPPPGASTPDFVTF